jgi:hypothetical protein
MNWLKTGLAGVMLFGPIIAWGNVAPATYTNSNYVDSYHEMPASFTMDQEGNFSGFTVTGRLFSQTNVPNSLGIRLQKFAIDEAYFYVSDRGEIHAANDLVAISIYLAIAG